MIIIKKYRELYIPEVIKFPFGISGEKRLILRNGEDLSVVQDTGWSPNLVTDYGLTRVGTASWHAYTHIGDDATAPVVGNTTLNSYVASSNTQISSVSTDPTGPNYQFSATIARRFPAGTGPTTVREMGIGPNTGDTNMIIHTLVSPAVTMSATQVLDVYHKFTVYPDLNDIVSTVTIGADTYDYTNRAMDVDSAGHNATATFTPRSAVYHDVYDGEIGATYLLSPSGSSDASASAIITGSGQGFHDYEVLFGLDDGVFGGGIRCFSTTPEFDFTGGRQIRFGKQGGGDETIPKTDHDELLFTLKMIWGRYP